MNVEFKFEINQKVLTPFQTEGFISHCCYARDGKSYYVKMARNSEWFAEDQLIKAD